MDGISPALSGIHNLDVCIFGNADLPAPAVGVFGRWDDIADLADQERHAMRLRSVREVPIRVMLVLDANQVGGLARPTGIKRPSLGTSLLEDAVRRASSEDCDTLINHLNLLPFVGIRVIWQVMDKL